MFTTAAIVGMVGSWAASHLLGMIGQQAWGAYSTHRENKIADMKMKWLQEVSRTQPPLPQQPQQPVAQTGPVAIVWPQK